MSEVREIAVNEAARRIDDYLAIDVREEDEYHGPLGHLPGAVLHPLASIPEALEAIDRGRRLLLVCRSGRRSHEACARLQAAGFRDVVNLAGGMLAWNEARLPVAGGAGEDAGGDG